MDLHAGQIQGFFNIPVDNLRTDWIFADHIAATFDRLDNTVIVSPDAGGAVRARMVAERLDRPLAILEKRRSHDGSDVQVLNVIGEVSGRRAILVDDILSSGETIVKAANTVLARGAEDVSAYCTHGVLSGNALKLVAESPLKRVVLANTIFSERANESEIVDYIHVGEHLAKTIHRIFEYKSVSHLFPHY
jgi:ribose-phosphate pyrophosphokinase